MAVRLVTHEPSPQIEQPESGVTGHSIDADGEGVNTEDIDDGIDVEEGD